MELNSDMPRDERPTLPVSGEIVGVLSILLGVLVSWRALQWTSNAGLLSFIPMLVLLVHAGVVVSAFLFLQRKGVGRQVLVAGLWCSALMQVPVTFIVTVFAIAPVSPFDGLFHTGEKTDHTPNLLPSLFHVLVNILTVIAAISLHRRSVRDAMGPPYIGFIRGNPRLETPEHEDER